MIQHFRSGTLLVRGPEYILGKVLMGPLKQYSFYNSLSYKIKFGWRESIKRPVTFSQKIYYLRNAYKDVPLATLVSDKIKVREYVQEKVGGDIINNLLGVYDDPRDIDYAKLPDRFVIKTNHSSGTNIIVKDKSSLNIEATNKQLSKWLKMNYANSSGEMVYYSIKPQILIEELIENEGFENPLDYKFWCFDGQVEFVQIFERTKKGFIRYSFDLTFRRISLMNQEDEGNQYDKFQKPSSFEEMIEYASELSKGWPFVRVDFYDINGRCIFGEMTLTPTAGNNYFLNDISQSKLGNKVNIFLLKQNNL